MAATSDMPAFRVVDRERPGFQAQQLEALASTLWTVLFLSHLSTTLSASYGTGMDAWYTVPLVALPVILAGLPGLQEGRPGAARTLTCYTIYAIAPGVIVLVFPTLPGRFLAAFAIIAPLVLALLPSDLSATGSVSAWASLTAALSAAHTYIVVAPLARPVGLAFRTSTGGAAAGALCSVLSIICGLLTARMIGLARFEFPRRFDAARESALLTGLLLNALCEETLYSGVVLNLLDEWLPTQPLIALMLSMSIFAFAHLHRDKYGYKAPNWRFAIVTAVYGAFCAIAWRISGRVIVAAAVHASFNYALRALLKKDSME